MPKTQTVLKTTTYDWDGNGVPDYTDWTESTREGDNLVREVSTTDYTGDGVPDQITTMDATFDNKGNMTAQTWLRDYDANGTPDSSEAWAWTYNNKGMQTQLVFTNDYNDDGANDYGYTQNTTYNRHGDVLVDATTYSWGQTDTTWNEYTRAGEITASYTDYGTDGTIDLQSLYEYPVA